MTSPLKIKVKPECIPSGGEEYLRYAIESYRAWRCGDDDHLSAAAETRDKQDFLALLETALEMTRKQKPWAPKRFQRILSVFQIRLPEGLRKPGKNSVPLRAFFNGLSDEIRKMKACLEKEDETSGQNCGNVASQRPLRAGSP